MKVIDLSFVDSFSLVYFISKGSIKFVTEISQGIFSLSQGTFFGEIEILENVIATCKHV